MLLILAIFLQAVFLVLKLADAGLVASWSWWWVASPTLIWLTIAIPVHYLVWRAKRRRRAAIRFLTQGIMSGRPDSTGQTAAQALVAHALQRAAERQRMGR